MFEENICVRLEGQASAIRLAPSIYQVALCCFGPSQALSLVVVSHTLNKLIVRDLSSTIKLGHRANSNGLTFESATRSATSDPDGRREEEADWGQQVAYISVRDVINSLASKRFHLNHQAGQALDAELSKTALASDTSTDRDLLLIGCSSSIVVYDTYEQAHLFNINTSSKITALLSPRASEHSRQAGDVLNAGGSSSAAAASSSSSSSWSTIFGAGVQKLYALQVERLSPFMPTTSLDKLINIEPTSERSTSDTISCLRHGRLDNSELVLTGSNERKIRVYLCDTYDQNIQACKLTLNESSKVNCLCAIATVPSTSATDSNKPARPAARPSDTGAGASSLPSVHKEFGAADERASGQQQQQMNHFAYGLENGFIGVYRLISTATTDGQERGVESSGADGQWSLFSERLWRHKSRQEPVSIVMFDINGDGLDELVFGFANGRLEARAPFSGQLVAKTRCFKGHGLVSLALLRPADYSEKTLAAASAAAAAAASADVAANRPSRAGQAMLLACSASMSLVGFWLQRCKPPKPLRDYLATRLDEHHAGANRALHDYSRQRMLGNSLDENDENEEDWTSSLSNLASLNAPAAAADTDDEPADVVLEAKPAPFDIFGQDLAATGRHLEAAIETQGDDATPVPCEGRQNVEQVQQISALYNEQAQIRQKFNKLYSDKLQQLSQFELNSPTANSINLIHRWDFDETLAQLRLSVLLKNPAGFVELFELVDRSCTVVRGERLLINNNSSHEERFERLLETRASSTNLVILPIAPFDQEAEVKLDLRIYCQQAGTKSLRFNQIVDATRKGRMLPHSIGQEPIVSRVYERTIMMPRFSMFIPERLGAPLEPHDGETERMMRLAFKLDENTSHLQILDWMRDNFLCFQFGQTQGALADRDLVWPSLDHLQPELLQSQSTNPPIGDSRTPRAAMFNRPTIYAEGGPQSTSDLNQAAPFDSVENWSSGRMGPNGELELDLKLVDLRRLRKQASAGRLRIAFSLAHVLTVECEDVDALVAIIDSLIVDCLRLNIREHSIVSRKDGCPKLDALAAKLETIADKTRQLEESERRIQTELYESADMTKSLMQQLAIANQLNEFNTSKELLSEITMMLDGALNSAQAFQLNNQEKLKMSKEANHLREKMSFVLESK